MPNQPAMPRQFCPEWWGLTTWLDAVLQNAPATPYLINLGASDRGAKLGNANADAVGLRMDNASFAGFAADPGHHRIYGSTNPNVATRRTAVTPSNIVSLLDAARAPADPHLLKVDIDSYDADVVRAVLSTRQPTFIFVELNEKIPPPLSLCFHFRTWSPWHFWHRGGHHYGCSLSAYSELLRGLGYSLVSVILNDALYVRTERAAAAGFGRGRKCRLPRSVMKAYRSGYSQLPKRKELFPWNAEVDSWLDESTPLPARHAAIRKFFWLDTLLGFAELKPLPSSRRASLPRDYVKWLEGK
jgi:hypothetical protein